MGMMIVMVRGRREGKGRGRPRGGRKGGRRKQQADTDSWMVAEETTGRHTHTHTHPLLLV